jgi:hypothetical protein
MNVSEMKAAIERAIYDIENEIITTDTVDQLRASLVRGEYHDVDEFYDKANAPPQSTGIDWSYTRRAAIDRINSQPDPLVTDLVAIIDGLMNQKQAGGAA